MTKNELLRMLEEIDGDDRVLIQLPDGGQFDIVDVRSATDRDPYDQDWDRSIVKVEVEPR